MPAKAEEGKRSVEPPTLSHYQMCNEIVSAGYRFINVDIAEGTVIEPSIKVFTMGNGSRAYAVAPNGLVG